MHRLGETKSRVPVYSSSQLFCWVCSTVLYKYCSVGRRLECAESRKPLVSNISTAPHRIVPGREAGSFQVTESLGMRLSISSCTCWVTDNFLLCIRANRHSDRVTNCCPALVITLICSGGWNIFLLAGNFEAQPRQMAYR